MQWAITYKGICLFICERLIMYSKHAGASNYEVLASLLLPASILVLAYLLLLASSYKNIDYRTSTTWLLLFNY